MRHNNRCLLPGGSDLTQVVLMEKYEAVPFEVLRLEY